MASNTSTIDMVRLKRAQVWHGCTEAERFVAGHAPLAWDRLERQDTAEVGISLLPSCLSLPCQCILCTDFRVAR